MNNLHKKKREKKEDNQCFIFMSVCLKVTLIFQNTQKENIVLIEK